MAADWFTLTVEEALRLSATDAEQGLSEVEAARRLAEHGPNLLAQQPPVSLLVILWRQLRSLVVALLAVAALLSLFFGDYLEAGAILGVLLLNTLIGFFTELRAHRSMESLRRLVEVTAKVIRQGTLREVAARDLVPGDLLVLEAGDLVSADARLVAAHRLAANEASLTGESLPVDKLTAPLADPATLLAERTNMVYCGTTVVRGSARAVVVATGARTELGEVAQLVEEASARETPLQHRLEMLGRALLWITLGVAVTVIAAGVSTGKGLFEMVETAVALAVAAIPEGLPVVATITLAIGLREMARKKAVVSKLDAVETLGSTTLIATDKTGTLTESAMRVAALLLEGVAVEVEPATGRLLGQAAPASGMPAEPRPPSSPLRDLLLAGLLCNNAAARPREGAPGEWETVGDPTEVALVIFAIQSGFSPEAAAEEWPREREVPFDPETKRMVTIHSDRRGGWHAFAKGAPESVLPICEKELRADGSVQPLSPGRRQELQAACEQLAAEGLRVLGLASGPAPSPAEDVPSGLAFLGAVGLLDPPRSDVPQAVAACQQAGVRVVMVTGDQEHTAMYVARQVGIAGEGAEVLSGRDLARLSEEEFNERAGRAAVFARVTPADKLRIVRALQAQGEVVAVFGDGVNDAPALKQADIGVVMGIRGTQVAKEAGDLILQDDRLGTIVSAVEGGRVIFRNLRLFVLYLLACNLSEVAVILVASLIRMPMPLKPLQILWVNLVTDVFPALALGREHHPGEAMTEPPRPRHEPFLGRPQYRFIFFYGSVMTIAVLAAYFFALKELPLTHTQATTVAFFSLSLAQLFFVPTVKASRGLRDRRALLSNGYVWLSILGCTLLVVALPFIPVLRTALSVEDPGRAGWLLTLAASLLAGVVGLTVNTLKGRGPGKT